MTGTNFVAGATTITIGGVPAAGVAVQSATFCFPYDEAAVATAGLAEEQLMVSYRPAGSPRWVDVTTSHDAAANRVCGLDSVSEVVIAGVSGTPLGHARDLAEGATGPFFDLFILVANPTDADADVEATYLEPDGQIVVRNYEVAANSRFNIWVDLEGPELADTAVSTTLHSTNDVPIIVERAMWWRGATWYEAHNSPGVTSTGTAWAVAQEQADASRNLETYILVANTSSTPADVKVTILFEDGATATSTYTGIPAHSRFDVPVGLFFPQAAGKRFGALVESVGAWPAPIVVECAMYWDVGGQFWAAGTNAVATKLR